MNEKKKLLKKILRGKPIIWVPPSRNCAKCNVEECNMNNKSANNCYFSESAGTLWFCNDCAYDKDEYMRLNQDKLLFEFIQPERSKREDSQQCEIRCSEHCRNTMRKVQ